MRALLPEPINNVSDEQLLERYNSAQRPFVRFNFVSSIDGSAQADGLSAKLGSKGDQRIFALLRRLADVIVVGAGTVRAEGYEGDLVSAEDREWRTRNGLSAHPALALISAGLHLNPSAEIFSQSPVPVIVFTTVEVTDEQRESYGNGVELIQVPEREGGCDPKEVVDHLTQRGLGFVHCEGGPHIFGQFMAAGMVDSACLSYSPVVVAGNGMRIAAHARQTFQRFSLNHLFEEESMLFCDYRIGQ